MEMIYKDKPYNNQVEAANKIVDEIKRNFSASQEIKPCPCPDCAGHLREAVVTSTDSNIYRCFHLISPMQGGKTGVIGKCFDLLYNEFTMNNPSSKWKYVLMSPVSDIALKKQSDERMPCVPGHEDSFVRVYHNPNLNAKLKEQDSSYHKIEDNTFLFVDEVHIGNERNSLMAHLFNSIGVDFADSTERINSILKERNIFIITVSATGFNILFRELNCKEPPLFKKIILRTEDNYYSVEKMFLKGQIIKAEKPFLAKGLNRKFTACLRESVNKGNFYSIIRSGKRTIELRDLLVDSFTDCDVKIYDQINENKFNKEELHIQPEKPTIILIRHYWRVGMTLDTRNVKLLYDTCGSTPLDTAAQSLVGRACGYNKDSFDGKVYTNIKEMQNYITFTNTGDWPKHSKINKYINTLKKREKKFEGEIPVIEELTNYNYTNYLNKKGNKQKDYLFSLFPGLKLLFNKYKHYPTIRDGEGSGKSLSSAQTAKQLGNKMTTGIDVKKGDKWGIYTYNDPSVNRITFVVLQKGEAVKKIISLTEEVKPKLAKDNIFSVKLVAEREMAPSK
jgi:hypothetical protein